MAIDIETVAADSPSPEVLARAAKIIARGEVIICPTDTGYALSANALDVAAVTGVFELKGRDFANPIHIAVDSLAKARRYASFNHAAMRLASHFLPGGLTLVLPKKEIVPSLLVAGRNTVGIRIPANKVILALAALSGLPLTATSANLSGRPTPYSVAEVVAQMGASLEAVGLILDQGALPGRGLSTIVDLTVDPPRLLRQGVISWEAIQQVLAEKESD